MRWLAFGGVRKRSGREPKCTAFRKNSNTSSSKCESGTRKFMATSSKREHYWNKNLKPSNNKPYRQDIPQFNNKRNIVSNNSWKKGYNRKKSFGDKI